MQKSCGLLNINESKEVILQSPLGVPSGPKGKAPEKAPRKGHDCCRSQPCSYRNWGTSCGLVALDGGSAVEIRTVPLKSEFIQGLEVQRGHMLRSYRSAVLGLSQAQVPYK
ncbi:hypothetical protein RHMOL_Rhmol01G0155100 [Rhododendron molle]|uniref:Uncharacterized protein n=1 Tax=Rhododendron molle TaxID=49168 RepID=A0ACC0Q4H6_RHOML|nr:hypothetical protein RHMOL_Rhmol01G0155100 [Rhododendron molle]